MTPMHKQVSVYLPSGRWVLVDEQLKTLIPSLNSVEGIYTDYSCQGTPEYAYVSIKGPRRFALLVFISALLRFGETINVRLFPEALTIDWDGRYLEGIEEVLTMAIEGLRQHDHNKNRHRSRPTRAASLPTVRVRATPDVPALPDDVHRAHKKRVARRDPSQRTTQPGTDGGDTGDVRK